MRAEAVKKSFPPVAGPGSVDVVKRFAFRYLPRETSLFRGLDPGPPMRRISHPVGGSPPWFPYPAANGSQIFVAATLALALSGCRPADPPPSVLLVVVDTLRADHVAALDRPGVGREKRPTPRLDHLASSSARFRRAVTPAPFTMPAMAAMMTGAYPDRTGVFAHRPGVSLGAWPKAPLAEAARRSGLATAAVVANPWLARPGTGFDRGFDEFSRLARRNRERGANAAPAVTDEALRLLEGFAGRRFFLWVHYFDPHMPYEPPPRWAREAGAAEGRNPVMEAFQAKQRDLGRLSRGEGFSEQAIEQARRLYEGEVRHVDGEIGRLLDGLEKLELASTTLVVVASDHGEALGEHGLFFAHDSTLYEELIRAVLLLRGPRVPVGARDDEVSLLDVAPTLCRLAALECDVAPDGRDLFGADRSPRTLFAASRPPGEESDPRGAIPGDATAGRWTMALRGGTKLLRRPSHGGTRLELYELGNDATEVRDLATRDEAVPRDLEGELEAWSREMDAVRPPLRPRLHGRAADRRSLRSLGYLQ
jgi:arylsulfatase A-like enzyme